MKLKHMKHVENTSSGQNVGEYFLVNHPIWDLLFVHHFSILRSRERAKYEPVLHSGVLFLSFSRTLFDRYILIYE